MAKSELSLEDMSDVVSVLSFRIKSPPRSVSGDLIRELSTEIKDLVRIFTSPTAISFAVFHTALLHLTLYQCCPGSGRMTKIVYQKQNCHESNKNIDREFLQISVNPRATKEKLFCGTPCSFRELLLIQDLKLLFSDSFFISLI